MSFGPSQAVKNANNTQSGITNQAIANSGTANAEGTSALNTGAGNVNSGTNFFNTLLNGNSANTASLLAPAINQNRATNQNQIQSLSTLMPRGGGRSGTLFNAAYQPSVSTQDAFNSMRGTAATTLPQIGLAQQGIGTNLFNIGNSALNTGAQSNVASAQQLNANQNRSDNLVSGLAGSLFGLATTPFGGGSSANGLLGLI